MDFEAHKNLKHLNTFGLDVHAAYYARFQSVEELIRLLNQLPTAEYMILGGGSNVLFTADYSGTLLHNHIQGIEVVREDNAHVWVKAGGGVVWHEFVLHCIGKNWGGIENLSLIPGSVGASPMQNIGAYGVEIKDVFDSLEALEVSTGSLHTFDREACRFGYRESVFKRELKSQFVITLVTFRLDKHHHIHTAYGAINDELSAMGIAAPTIRDVSNAVIRIRQSKLPDPKEIGNAGSFFKNPVVPNSVVESLKQRYPAMPVYPIDEATSKVPAGWLIEQDGWKGKRFEDYGVHAKQALVLVNYGSATGKQIYDLSGQIIESVKQHFGIELEREVNMI